MYIFQHYNGSNNLVVSSAGIGVIFKRLCIPRRIIAIVVACLCTPFYSSTAAPRSPKQFEKPSILKASNLLAPELMQGPHHSVNEKVTSDGYFNNYTITSQFGAFTVEGQALLEIRIGEMAALAELNKLSSSSVFADAAYKAGKGIVMAPVTIVKKTAQTVSDPDKLVDTLSGIPEGAEKLLSWVYRKSKGAATAVGDALSPSSQDTKNDTDSKAASKTTTETVGDTLDQGASFGLKFIGYTKRQREWFRKLHVNPYTSNQILRDEVMRVAGIETAVGTAFKFVPGLGLLGELSTFNTWYQRAEKLSLYEDPETIGKKNGKELLALGVSDEITKRFVEHPAYTPWTRRFISASLTEIGPSVAGHSDFIRAACEATNEPSTLYFVSIAEHLEKVHKRSPLARITAPTFLPTALLKDGSLYLPLSIDYLFWTEEVAGILTKVISSTVPSIRAKRLRVAIRDKTSALARRSLEALGVSVTEGWSPTAVSR